MTPAKVAKTLNISTRMLRYYEEAGLVQPRRKDNNYRDYQKKDIEVIKKIQILSDAGMTLKDIEVLLPCFDLEERNFSLCAVVTAKLQAEIAEADKQMQALARSQALLKEFLKNGTPDDSQ